jgi:DNA-binding NarL/FixJ family response regulator
MKVFIVDDSSLLCERLVDMLSELEKIEIVGKAEHPLEAINSIRMLQPDVVILDISILGGSGINVLEDIKKDKLSPIVIMFTNSHYQQYRKKCMDAGADFFLDKSIEFEKMIDIFIELTASR